jgi:hypothetical protein
MPRQDDLRPNPCCLSPNATDVNSMGLIRLNVRYKVKLFSIELYRPLAFRSLLDIPTFNPSCLSD